VKQVMTLLEHAPVALAPAPVSRIDLARLRGRVTRWSLVAAAVAALGQTAGTVVAGQLAVHPSGQLVSLLALCVVGAAVFDTGARVAWAGVVDRAEGELRADLLDAALHQPLSVLSEQAVGEVLDRVDDDTHELGALLRRMAWDLVRTGFRAIPMWAVAGLTWWPAWVLFPVFGVLTILVVRPLTGEMARLKVAEEIAWTDHAAALEEGIAARDDVRSSLGQAFVVRRLAELSAEVHRRVAARARTATQISRRAGLVLHLLLSATAVLGICRLPRSSPCSW
jgi:ATP-binding cassette subfamily B protein